MQIKAKTVLESKSMASANTTCKNNSWQNAGSMCTSSPKQTQISLQHAPPPPWTPPQRTHTTPRQPPHGASHKRLWWCWCWHFFNLVTPTGLFSNLRTACSETLMLRERKASMADRSLSSLTGELLLLATAAVAFTTFAARRLSGDGELRGTVGWPPRLVSTWRWFGSVEREYVMCGGGRRNHHPSTRPTWAGDQRSQATQRRGRVQTVGPQRSKGIGHMEGEGPGAMQEGSRMTRATPKTTTTTQHQTAGGRRGVKWGIERKKNKGEN